MKIALGSVQFGCDYGVSNNQGQVSTSELSNILALAKSAGIEVIDTAPAYGNSEHVLGKQSLGNTFNFISKISPNLDPKKISASIKASLQALKTEQLSALMLHHGKELLGVNGKEIYQQLLSAKQQGLSKKIGCSVYSAKEALTISNKFALDIVQIPANIFDQGILKDDVLTQLKYKEIEVHIRSLFLQGAVFLNEHTLPINLKSLAPHLNSLARYATELNTAKPQYTSHTALIAHTLMPFVKNKYIDKLVIGCCSSNELQQILIAYQLAKNIDFDFSVLAITEPSIINPSLW